jgi:hypothetical protein
VANFFAPAVLEDIVIKPTGIWYIYIYLYIKHIFGNIIFKGWIAVADKEGGKISKFFFK